LTPVGLQNASAALAGGDLPPDLALATLASITIVLGAGMLAWLVLRRREL
jgi:hypothetical protein